jgi:hypothetical protein
MDMWKKAAAIEHWHDLSAMPAATITTSFAARSKFHVKMFHDRSDSMSADIAFSFAK